MKVAQPQTARRAFHALLAAVALATAAKAGLVLVLPLLLQSSFSALSGNFADAQLHWEILKPLALLRGAIGAALCLTPAFLIANRLRAGPSGYALAGTLAEFIHNALSALLLEPALSSLDKGTLFLETVRPETLVLQGNVAIAVASLIAGGLAGADFAARVLPGEWRKPPLYRRPPFLVTTLVLLSAGWWVFHDREGDQLCAHTDIVRLSVDGTNYRLPVTMQPYLKALDPHKPLHILLPQYHVYSNADVAARYQMVYCQTADEPAWPVRGFFVTSRAIPSAPATLPPGIEWISIYGAEAITPPAKEALELSPPPIPGLDRLQGKHMVYGNAIPALKHGLIGIRLADGTLMNSEMDIDFGDPADALPFYRHLADFLTKYRVHS